MKKYSHISILAPEFWPTYDAALVALRARAGTFAEVSRKLGIKRNVTTLWFQHKRLPTLEQAACIEKQFNISKKSLRPDVDWTYIRDIGTNIPAEPETVQAKPGRKKTIERGVRILG